MKNKINKQSQIVDTQEQPQCAVADQVADDPDTSATTFDAILSRMKLATEAKSDTAFAKLLGLSQSSVSGAKERQSIPPAWAIQIAEKYAVSIDWLMFGQGNMKRGGGMMFKTAKLPNPQMDPASCAGRCVENEPDGLPDSSIYNDASRRSISIADMLAKTAKVLESDTVYREALYSNIEAFHHGVTMDERVNKMEQQFSQAMASFQSQLDQLRDENQQLRHELEESRSQSAIRDTG